MIESAKPLSDSSALLAHINHVSNECSNHGSRLQVFHCRLACQWRTYINLVHG